jgi:hypothetical protein
MDDFCPAMSRFAYGGKQMAQYRRNCRAAAATFAGFLAAQVLSPFPHDVGVGTLTAGAVGLLVVFVVGIVVHELGHVLAIRLAGRQPTVVHLLGPSHRVLTFHFGTVPVRVGFKGGGRVEYPGDGLSVWQSALIAAAGPAAELVIAPLLLLLPVARWESDYFACCVAAWAIGNLIPAKTPSGRLSDGAVLLQVRARARAEPGIRDMLATPGWSSRPDAASRLIKGWVLDVPEAEQCLMQLPSDRATLLKVYAQDVPLPVSPATAYLKIVHALSWKVVAKPRRACGANWPRQHPGRMGCIRSLTSPSTSGRLAARASGGLGVGLDVIGASGGGGPGEGAGCGLVEVPLRVLFELMMEAAERTEVTGAGGAVLVVGLGVVGVAAFGGLAAGGEPAGQVAQVDELAEPGRDLVGRAGLGMGASPGGGVGGCSSGGPAGCLPGGGDDRCGHVRGRFVWALAVVGCGGEFAGADDHGDPAQEAAGPAGTGPGWSGRRGW